MNDTSKTTALLAIKRIREELDALELEIKLDDTVEDKIPEITNRHPESINSINKMTAMYNKIDADGSRLCGFYRDNLELAVKVMEQLHEGTIPQTDFEDIVLADNGPTPTPEGIEFSNDLVEVWNAMDERLHQRFFELASRRLKIGLRAASYKFLKCLDVEPLF